MDQTTKPEHKLLFLDGELQGYELDGFFDLDFYKSESKIKFTPSDPDAVDKKAWRFAGNPQSSGFQILNFDKSLLLQIGGKTTFHRLIPCENDDGTAIKHYRTALFLEGDVAWISTSIED